MLTVFVFDNGESGREKDLRAALDHLADDALLWIALLDPSEEEAAAVQEALDLSDEQAARLLEQPSRPSLIDAGEHMHATLYAASSENGEPILRSVECVIGRAGSLPLITVRSRCWRSSANAPKEEVESVNSTQRRLSQRLPSGLSPATSAPLRRRERA